MAGRELVHVAEPGCDLGRLAQLVSLEDGGRGHVTFSCDGEATRGSLYCNGSHWSGDTDTCGGEILTRGLLGHIGTTEARLPWSGGPFYVSIMVLVFAAV